MNEASKEQLERARQDAAKVREGVVKERVPTREELTELFERIVGANRTEKEPKEDGFGIVTWVVEGPGEKEGETAEYTYSRQTDDAVGGSLFTTIEAAYYDDTGFPIGGKTIATLKDGEWEFR